MFSLVQYELYVFFATISLMGLNQTNRMKDYGLMGKLIIKPTFEELFAMDRCLSLLQYFHFADNNTGRRHAPENTINRGIFEK